VLATATADHQDAHPALSAGSAACR
jgi:hypothetical protein